MRITIIAYGTRGDVQPAIALGRALQTSGGHRVRIVASAHFKPWIESHGLEAACSDVDVHALLESEAGIEWVESGSNPLKQVRMIQRIVKSGVGRAMLQDAWDAAQDAGALISSFTSDVYAVSIAQKLGIKHISMPLQPAFVATRSGAVTLNAPVPHRNSLLNYLLGKWFIESFTWRLYGEVANAFRVKVLKLPPQTQPQNFAAMRRMLVIQGFSAHVVPHPADWPTSIHTTGYWFLDEHPDWQPPQELRKFLDVGDPPVCIGFGSMTGRDPLGVTRLVVDAVTQSGKRAVLLSGWAGIGDANLPSTILPMSEVPHEWLFPRMAAVVHHGGAGTTRRMSPRRRALDHHPALCRSTLLGAARRSTWRRAARHPTRSLNSRHTRKRDPPGHYDARDETPRR